MLFTIHCTDKPGSRDLRLATRGAHLAYLQDHAGCLVQAGPSLDLDGKPSGSLLLVNLAGRAEAEALAAGDPYAEAGLFESTVIRGYRSVFRDGALIE
ncbi:YciI family protein [Lichenicoccus sp.]|uniref:YciI family protein n=1 Tax=Lichenicoccus sp. TaxID=2781899 RepID=UPI003D117832